MLLYGVCDLLAIKVYLDNLRATSLAITSHCGAHSGVYALVDGILHLLNVQNARFTATCISDDFNAISSKSHSIGGRTFTKGFEYDKARVKKLTGNHGGTLQYEYDAMGRISKEKDSGGNVLKAYTYDSFGQLEWETNYILDKTFQYVYNGIGNLTSVTVNGATTQFGYSDAYPDRLASYNGKAITYNSLGYPVSYDGKTLTWTRGKLTQVRWGNIKTGTHVYNYTYNAYGQRVSKTYSFLPGKGGSLNDNTIRVTNSTRDYYYDHSGRLIGERYVENYSTGNVNNEEIVYIYDESSVIGMVYTLNGATSTYYYQRNLQGDVVAIYSANGVKKAEYIYDAFGNCTITNDSDISVANTNSIRYRGYYFDVETSWYFLNARYYNPEWRRFISPDDTSYLDPETPNGLNLYCYCGNDPINFVDPSGCFAIELTVLGMIVFGTIGATLGGLVAYNVAQNSGAEGWELFGWTVIGVVGGGTLGAAIGYGIGALITHLTGIVGLSITKYYILPIKNITVLGHMETYSQIAQGISAGYFFIDPKKWETISDFAKWASNETYLADANKLGSQFVIVPEEVVKISDVLWKEIQFLIQNGIPWYMS